MSPWPTACQAASDRLYYRPMGAPTLFPAGLAALNGFGTSALGFLFPERCIVCGRWGQPLCSHCAEGIESIRVLPGCPRCAAPPTDDATCPYCRPWDAIDAAFPAFHYEGAARQMVHALKYRRQRSLVPVIARHLAGLEIMSGVQAAFPVPLHPARFRSRGFNQAERLLRELPLPRSAGRLRRTRNTRSQVGLNPAQRRANVADAFEYAGGRLDGLHVAIVDDVITTGATVNECARALRAAGAAKVTVISFARARHYQPSPETPIDD